MSEKNLVIRLKRYHKIWYDLLEDKNAVAEYFDTRDLISKKMIEIENELENNRGFVYFICSREKIRFDTSRKPRYKCFSSSIIYIPIITEDRKTLIKVELPELRNMQNKNRPRITITEKYITFYFKPFKKTISIHDFIASYKIILGHSNKVEYVGYTTNPSSRPTNGSHSGLSAILYKFMTSNNNRDIMIYFNEFNYYIDNDKLEKELNIEKDIIEKSFISYFDSESQNRNRDKEDGRLINSLKILEKEKISSVSFDYEFAVKDGYSNFSSHVVPDSHIHNFSVRLCGNKIIIDKNKPTNLNNFSIGVNSNWTVYKNLD